MGEMGVSSIASLRESAMIALVFFCDRSLEFCVVGSRIGKLGCVVR